MRRHNRIAHIGSAKAAVDSLIAVRRRLRNFADGETERKRRRVSRSLALVFSLSVVGLSVELVELVVRWVGLGSGLDTGSSACVNEKRKRKRLRERRRATEMPWSSSERLVRVHFWILDSGFWAGSPTTHMKVKSLESKVQPNLQGERE